MDYILCGFLLSLSFFLFSHAILPWVGTFFTCACRKLVIVFPFGGVAVDVADVVDILLVELDIFVVVLSNFAAPTAFVARIGRCVVVIFVNVYGGKSFIISESIMRAMCWKLEEFCTLLFFFFSEEKVEKRTIIRKKNKRKEK